MWSRWVSGLLMLCAAASHAAGVDPALPYYEPRDFAAPMGAPYVTATRAIKIVGYNDMRDMLEPLVARFVAAHPGTQIALDLPGTRFAPAALAAGTSALAPMGAEFTPPQLDDYRKIAGDDPLEFRVAHASLDPRALSGPLGIFVHRDNPMGSLTLVQLARAYAGDASRWGDLGASGDWADRPLHLYGMEPGTALAHFMQKSALGGKPLAREMKGFPQSADVVRRVGDDPLALGFAAAMRT